MRWIEAIHDRKVANRRAQVLSQHLTDVIPQGASVLDVGCGDGEIASLVQQARPDLTITGVEVLLRAETKIPVIPFDGERLPYADESFDVVSFVDVLHHCDAPGDLLREAVRVSRRWIVIKDHRLQGLAAGRTLRLMDWVGNHRYGVALPYNYWRDDQWQGAFAQLGLSLAAHVTRLHLYPWPFSCLFDRQLHFVARLEKPAAKAPISPREFAWEPPAATPTS